MVKGGDGACLWARRFRRAAGDAAVLVVRIWVSLPPGGAASAECSAGHVGLPYLSPRGMRNHPQVWRTTADSRSKPNYQINFLKFQ